MFSRGIAVSSLFAFVAVANAGVNIGFVVNPDKPMYDPGEVVAVDITLTQTPAGGDHLLRLVQFDIGNATNAAFPAINLVPTQAGNNFWDFQSTTACQNNAANCGTGHFVDDEKIGPGILGPDVLAIAYYFVNSANLAENPDAQITLPPNTPVRVGRMSVTMPAAGGTYTLDVINTGNTNQNRGGIVYYGFGLTPADPVTILRAGGTPPNNLTGGTRQFVVTTIVPEGATLMDSSPLCDQSLWRTKNNFVILNFDMTLPGGTPAVKVLEIASNGVEGEDVTASFTMTVDGSSLRLAQVGDTGRPPVNPAGVIKHRRWYVVRSNNWAGVNDFRRQYVVQIGDANVNNGVNSLDVSAVNGFGTCFNVTTNCPQKIRGDVDGNNNINSLDVSTINGIGTSFPVTKPTMHTCLP